MKTSERILTRHPAGKRRRHDTVRANILKTLRRHPGMALDELADHAIGELQPSFDGKVPWYLVTVKFDLEARGKIERIPKTSPQQLRLSRRNFTTVSDRPFTSGPDAK